MQCQAEGCNGTINEEESRSIYQPCIGSSLLVHPCSECGLLHWKGHGHPLRHQGINSFIFLKDGVVVDENGNEVNLEDN